VSVSRPASAPRQRLSADERRTQVVAAAIRRFAAGGLAGTSTEDIAADVGLSQPYLFRLFRTKRDLFLACCEASYQRVSDTFAASVEGLPMDAEQRLGAMGQTYLDLLVDRDELRFQLQMYAASAADADIREPVRAGYKALIDRVRDLTGASEERLWAFAAHGMMCNLIAAMDLPAVADQDEWAAAWSNPKPTLEPS
jgi:AcrR family transcriptional regulator